MPWLSLLCDSASGFSLIRLGKDSLLCGELAAVDALPLLAALCEWYTACGGFRLCLDVFLTRTVPTPIRQRKALLNHRSKLCVLFRGMRVRVPERQGAMIQRPVNIGEGF